MGEVQINWFGWKTNGPPPGGLDGGCLAGPRAWEVGWSVSGELLMRDRLWAPTCRVGLGSVDCVQASDKCVRQFDSLFQRVSGFVLFF